MPERLPELLEPVEPVLLELLPLLMGTTQTPVATSQDVWSGSVLQSASVAHRGRHPPALPWPMPSQTRLGPQALLSPTVHCWRQSANASRQMAPAGQLHVLPPPQKVEQ